jgi:hypothetical protein
LLFRFLFLVAAFVAWRKPAALRASLPRAAWECVRVHLEKPLDAECVAACFLVLQHTIEGAQLTREDFGFLKALLRRALNAAAGTGDDLRHLQAFFEFLACLYRSSLPLLKRGEAAGVFEMALVEQVVASACDRLQVRACCRKQPPEKALDGP